MKLVPTQPSALRLSDVLAGLSHALDLTEGQRPGHAVRTSLIGMRIADVLRLPQEMRSPLFYALLMKDLGCSSNAARFAVLFGADDHGVKCDLKVTNWSRPIDAFRFAARNVAPGQFWLRRTWQFVALMSRGPAGARDVVLTRCERGADIARMLAFPDETVRAIRALDEHWDGDGQPYSLRGDQIPLLARILGLAQTVEVYFTSFGVDAAYEMATSRRGSWFDPQLVDALVAFRGDAAFWQSLGTDEAGSMLSSMEPPDRMLAANDDRLDRIAEAFALVIDAKSPWTHKHSRGVADVSVAVASTMGYAEEQLCDVRRAALLHDVGKLGVSSLILDKPDRLTDDEFAAMRQHPHGTREILKRTGCFSHLANIAAAHHERLDGSGYNLGLAKSELPLLSRVLCVSDICDALRASRPYRPGLPVERVLDIMRRDVGTGIDPLCFEALETVLHSGSLAQAGDVQAARYVPALSEDYSQAA
ncbi:MAG TPA: HD domain-containing phosphohydrolase [Vicinamibacterales bacterium]